MIVRQSQQFDTPAMSPDGFSAKYCMINGRTKSIRGRVSIDHLAGQIGYALAPMIANGAMLGRDQPVILHLLDLERAANPLEGLKCELIDAAFPLLKVRPRPRPRPCAHATSGFDGSSTSEGQEEPGDTVSQPSSHFQHPSTHRRVWSQPLTSSRHARASTTPSSSEDSPAARAWSDRT